MAATAALVALDWGTSSLRAYRFDRRGTVVDSVADERGIVTVADAAAFDTIVSDLLTAWDQPATVPVVAAGMVGSRQGWIEAPYVELPADLTDLAHQLVTVRRDGPPVHVVPGMVDTGALPSVMRGEETQLVGVLPRSAWTGQDTTPRLVVLPGTHTKWVHLEGHEVTSIATTMTGELYALLTRHSLLATTMRPGPAADRRVFRDAVHLARASGVGATSTIFSTRSLGLLDRLAPQDQAEHLSGLLIAHELLDHPPAPDAGWTLAGDPRLCARYAQAADLLGRPAPTVVPDAAPRGLWRLAVAAGLVPSSEGDPA